MVILRVFTLVKPTYLGQIHHKSPMQIHLGFCSPDTGKKFWEGHTTDIGSQVFHEQLNFLERKFKKARCAGI